MKKLLALVLVLGLAVVAVAQDLDSAVQGVDAPQAAQQGGNGVFDQIMAKLHEMESKYIARQVSEWEWIKWGYWRDGGYRGQGGPFMLYSWRNSSDIHYEMWDQLSPAEFAAAKAEWQASWNRIVAAGLN